MDLAGLISAKRPEIKQASIDLYVRSINILHDNKEYKTLRQLYNTDKMLKKLEAMNLAPTTYKNYVQAMAVALDALPTQTKKIKDTIQTYRKIMFEREKARQKFVDTHEKSPKEEKNWVTLKYLKEVANKLKRLNFAKGADPDITLLQDYVIALFYSSPPILPRLEIANLMVVPSSVWAYYLDGEKRNYILWNKKERKMEMFINESKTSKHTGPRSQVLPKELYLAITALIDAGRPLIKEFPGKATRPGKGVLDPTSLTAPLLFYSTATKERKPLTANALGKNIARIFKNDVMGQRPTVTTIRHIIISEQVDLEKEDALDKLADGAGHSRKQQRQYAKKKSAK